MRYGHPIRGQGYNKNSKFVCLEPWSSVPVYCDKEENITKMPHAIRLSPENEYVFAYSIEIG